jgi:hypothetical protein
MKIILTNHAKSRMLQRNIKIKDIKDCLEFPELKILKEKIVEFRKMKGGRQLSIICKDTNIFIKIITVMWKD